MRLHNVMILGVVCLGLLCVAIVQSTRGTVAWRVEGATRRLLTALRIGLPIAGMLATAALTYAGIRACARRGAARPCGRAPSPSDAAIAAPPVAVPDDVVATFRRCKLASMWTLFACAAFAATCLLVAHRTMDVLLALLPLALLVIARPSEEGLAQFGLMIEDRRTMEGE